jgi:hypothetical protein
MSQAITPIQLSPLAALPALFTPDARTAKRTVEFFTAYSGERDRRFRCIVTGRAA